jgi:hypothetical protein
MTSFTINGITAMAVQTDPARSCVAHSLPNDLGMAFWNKYNDFYQFH